MVHIAFQGCKGWAEWLIWFRPWRQSRFCDCSFLALRNRTEQLLPIALLPPTALSKMNQSGIKAEVLTDSKLVRCSKWANLPSERWCLWGVYSQLAQSCDQTCLWLATGKLSTIYNLLLGGGGGRDHLGASNTAVWSAWVRQVSLWLCAFSLPLTYFAPDNSMDSELSI